MFMLASAARPRPTLHLTFEPARGPRTVRWLGALGSLAVHGAALSAVVLLTLPHPAPRQPPLIDLGQVLPAPSPASTPPHAPHPLPSAGAIALPVVPPVELPTDIPPIPDDSTGWPAIDPRSMAEISFGVPTGGGSSADLGAVFREAAVDEPPLLLSAPPLEYPRALLQAGVEGTVLVEVVIDTLGRAEPTTLHVRLSPHPGLAAAARGLILRSRYRPGRLDGRKVRVRVRVPVVFRIHPTGHARR